MKQIPLIYIFLLVGFTFTFPFIKKEGSPNKLIQLVTSDKINQLVQLSDKINANKFQVKDIVDVVPVFQNLLADVLNQLLEILPLIKDVVPYYIKPFCKKAELLTYKAVNLLKEKEKLQIIQANAQRIIDSSKDLAYLKIRPQQIKQFFQIMRETFRKLKVPPQY